MKKLIHIMLLLLTSACASDRANRSMYETLENIRRQQCISEMSSDCPERESYNDYTRKREEVVK